MSLDLYRERTQIRLGIYNTDTSKLEKCYIFYTSLYSFSVPSLIIVICLIVLLCSEIIQIKEYFVA